jgi:hypothetical protein
LIEQRWLEEIDRNIQELLAQSALQDREVELRSRSDLSLEIIVDGKVHQNINEVTDVAIRKVIKVAIDKWQDQTEAAALVHAAMPVHHPMIATILVLITLLVLIRPIHMAIRVGLSWTGAMIGGLIGALGGRMLSQRIKGDNPSVGIPWGLLGGMAGVLLGFMVTASILSFVS